MGRKPTAHIVHQTPSRVRLRIPEKRHDKAFFVGLAKTLGDLLDAEVDVNPTTSGVLIVAKDAMSLVGALGDKAPFELVDDARDAGVTLPQLRQQFEGWNARFTRFIGGGADARSYIILVLIASSVLQVARGRTLAPAVTMLWYASEGLRLWAPVRDQRPH